MAMNKKELAEVEELKTKLALRFTPEISKDVPKPTYEQKGLSVGYVFNEYTLKIEKACSSFAHHGVGQHDRTTSQQSIEMYSTELLAAKAMRNALEKKFAKELRKVDIKIESLTITKDP